MNTASVWSAVLGKTQTQHQYETKLKPLKSSFQHNEAQLHLPPLNAAARLSTATHL